MIIRVLTLTLAALLSACAAREQPGAASPSPTDLVVELDEQWNPLHNKRISLPTQTGTFSQIVQEVASQTGARMILVDSEKDQITLSVVNANDVDAEKFVGTLAELTHREIVSYGDQTLVVGSREFTKRLWQYHPGSPSFEPLKKKFYKLSKARPSELLPLMQRCLTDSGTVDAVDAVSTLVVTDYAKGHTEVARTLALLGLTGGYNQAQDLDPAH